MGQSKWLVNIILIHDGYNRIKMFKIDLSLKKKNSEEKTQGVPRLRDHCDREVARSLQTLIVEY